MYLCKREKDMTPEPKQDLKRRRPVAERKAGRRQTEEWTSQPEEASRKGEKVKG